MLTQLLLSHSQQRYRIDCFGFSVWNVFLWLFSLWDNRWKFSFKFVGLWNKRQFSTIGFISLPKFVCNKIRPGKNERNALFDWKEKRFFSFFFSGVNTTRVTRVENYLILKRIWDKDIKRDFLREKKNMLAFCNLQQIVLGFSERTKLNLWCCCSMKKDLNLAYIIWWIQKETTIELAFQPFLIQSFNSMAILDLWNLFILVALNFDT